MQPDIGHVSKEVAEQVSDTPLGRPCLSSVGAMWMDKVPLLPDALAIEPSSMSFRKPHITSRVSPVQCLFERLIGDLSSSHCRGEAAHEGMPNLTFVAMVRLAAFEFPGVVTASLSHHHAYIDAHA